MSTEHTPGPWKVDESGSMIETEYQVNLRGEYKHICDFRKNFAGDGFDTATAQLISAAPELLEACKTALYCVEVEMADGQEGWASTHATLSAAVAKATGKETI